MAIQPVISDGRLAPVLAQEWGHPLVLWATPEEQTGEMISGNSLVSYITKTQHLQGVNFTNNLRAAFPPISYRQKYKHKL